MVGFDNILLEDAESGSEFALGNVYAINADQVMHPKDVSQEFAVEDCLRVEFPSLARLGKVDLEIVIVVFFVDEKGGGALWGDHKQHKIAGSSLIGLAGKVVLGSEKAVEVQVAQARGLTAGEAEKSEISQK